MPTPFDLLTGALYSQHARLITVETAQDSTLPATLVVERFEGREGINELFCFDIDLLSTSAHIALKTFIGEQITLRLLQANGQYRAWHGYCTEASWLGADGGLTRYRLRLEPFLAFLRLRRNCLVFQDKHAQAIVTQLLADYPQAQFTCDITSPQTVHPVCTQYRESDLTFFTRVLAAEGLSWRFQHAQDATVATDAPSATQLAKHLLVIFDPHALAPELPGERTLRFHGIRATDTHDAIDQFSAQRRVQPNAVAVASWDPTQLRAPAAEQTSALDNGDLPRLSIYDNVPERRYATAADATRHSDRMLQALELRNKTFTGRGSVRHLAAGYTFTLTQHAHYPLGHNDFTVLWVEHAAVNNLDARIPHHAASIPAHDPMNDNGTATPPGHDDPERLTAQRLERGTYRNRFACVRHSVPIVPLATAQRRAPTALGPQIAIVIAPPLTGENAPITTDRDHRVLIRFPWQRPDPVTGAPAPGQWARVGEALAGPNWGSLFTPRVGTEVLINFLGNDIDHPVIIGCLYNGDDLPPYPGGTDSSANHPGTLSGIHSQNLDGTGYTQWQIDDTATQLRMRIASSAAASQLNLGHLIAQTPSPSPQGAQRGAYRGQGFELRTDAGGALRGGAGVLLTTQRRPGHGTSVTATQLDAAESHAQLNSAAALTHALYDAARHQTALTSKTTQHSQRDFTDAFTPANDPALAASQAWPAPVILIDSPAAITWASPASTAVSAAQQIHSTSQSDLHLTAAQTLASVAGNATTLFTHRGGIHAIAAHGPVSLQAHTDQLDILADDSVTVTSVNGTIDIKAHQKIVLHAGQSSITLEGQNITFTCPGKLSIKGGVHGFKGGEGKAAELEGLPSGTVSAVNLTPSGVPEMSAKSFDEAFQIRDPTGEPIPELPYQITTAEGKKYRGITDEKGYTERIYTMNASKLKIEPDDLL